MRLSPEQVAIIRQATADTFGPDAHVWLFDSDVDEGIHSGHGVLLLVNASGLG